MNKLIRVFLFATICFTAISCTNTITDMSELRLEDTTPTRNCDNKMIRKMKQTEGFSEMFSKAVIENGQASVCTDVFPIDGSCCDLTKLTNFIKTKSQKWKDRIQNFIKRVNHLESKLIKQGATVAAKIERMDNWLTKHSTKGSSETRSAVANLRKASEKLNKFLEPETFKQRKESYVSNAKTCFETLMKVKTNAYCYMCSPRADDFTSGTNLKINSATCNSVLNACSHTFLFTYELMTTAKALYMSNKLMRLKSGTENFFKNTGPDTTSEASLIISKLRTLTTMSKDEIVDTSLTEELCNSLLVVDGDNDDILGDSSILDLAAESEDGNDPEEVKTDIKEKVTEMANKIKEFKEKKKEKIVAAFVPFKKALDTAKKSLEDIASKVKTIREEIKTEKDKMNMKDPKERGPMKTNIKPKLIQLKNEAAKAKTALNIMNNAYVKFITDIQGEISEEKKTAFKEKMKEYREFIAKIDTAEEEQNDILNQESTQLIDEINSTEDSMEVEYKKWRAIYDEYNKKAVPSRRMLAETTQNQRLINMETIYDKVAKQFNQLQIEIKEFRQNNSSFIGPKLIHNLKKPIGDILRRARIMKKFHDSHKSTPVPTRILSDSTAASGQVSVSSGGLDLTKDQSSPQAASTTIDTSAMGGNSYASIVKFGSFLALILAMFFKI